MLALSETETARQVRRLDDCSRTLQFSMRRMARNMNRMFSAACANKVLDATGARNLRQR
jgi:hypothetical protein